MTPKASSPSSNTENNKEVFVHRLFDAIASRYDLFCRLSSFGLDASLRRRTVQSLNLAPGMRVLDLASGSGGLAIEAAREILPLGQVIASDISGPMLAQACRRLARHPVAGWHVQVSLNRAEALSFKTGSFDAAAMGFALRNVSDLNNTFQELARVIRPGGRVGLLEFSRPQHPLLRWGFKLWLAVASPLIGVLSTGRLWPFLYLRRSVLQFIPSEEVIQSLEGAGFQEVRKTALAGGSVALYQGVRA